jgi:hypothetical protein
MSRQCCIVLHNIDVIYLTLKLPVSKGLVLCVLLKFKAKLGFFVGLGLVIQRPLIQQKIPNFALNPSKTQNQTLNRVSIF